MKSSNNVITFGLILLSGLYNSTGVARLFCSRAKLKKNSTAGRKKLKKKICAFLHFKPKNRPNFSVFYKIMSKNMKVHP